MLIKKFKNGNFSITAESSDLSGSGSYLERDGLELIIDLCNSAELDFVVIGDEGCNGNWDMYYPLYNYYTGMMYLPTGSDCELYRQGKTVKLYAIKPDADDMAVIREEV